MATVTISSPQHNNSYNVDNGDLVVELTAQVTPSGSGSSLDFKQCYDCSGIYLKWLNQLGGYEYKLFKNIYQTKEKSKELGKAQIPDVMTDNIATYKPLGKQNTKMITIHVDVDNADYEVAEDLIRSPEVYIYIDNKFIRITTKSGIDFNSGISGQKLSFDFELPEILTHKLI